MLEVPVVLAVIYICVCMFLVAAVAGMWARVRYLEDFIKMYEAPVVNKLTGGLVDVQKEEPAMFDACQAIGTPASGPFLASFNHLDASGNLACTRYRITKRYVRPTNSRLDGRPMMEERDHRDGPWTPCEVVHDPKHS